MNKIDNYRIHRFFIICFLGKFLPLLYIYYIEDLNVNIDDMIFTIILFIVYNINLLLNDTDLYQVYKDYTILYLDETRVENNLYYIQVYDYIYAQIFFT